MYVFDPAFVVTPMNVDPMRVNAGARITTLSYEDVWCYYWI